MHYRHIVAPIRVPQDALRVRVVHVGDGDGFRAKLVVRTGIELDVNVRFGFVDAPELSQKGGPEARAFLRSLIEGAIVDLAVTNKTGTGDFIDRYGRIVGVPFLTEAASPAITPIQGPVRKVFGTRGTIVRNIELEMVLNGWAWVLDKYGPHGSYRHAQEEARRFRRGIWAFDSNLSPWAFKKQVNSGHLPPDRHLAGYSGPVTDNIVRSCPRHGCGGTMKVRKGKHGQFLGCSNFPVCKVTRRQ